MDPYGTYEWPDDSDYDYPAGAYGVMSWWDYGHWITTRAERIPVANPFQQNAGTAANYLLAPSEQQAEQVLEDNDEDDATTRFVMIDWQMVSPTSKFGAPVVFYDESNVSQQDFYETVFVLQETQQGTRATSSFQVRSQRYYESQMVRLYYYHGSAQEPQPVVLDWEQRQFEDPQTGETTTYPVVVQGGQQRPIQTFDNMSAAREYAEDRETAQVGGFGPYPQERVPALQHYRLVKVSESSATNQLLRGEIGLIRAAGFQNPGVVLPTAPQYVKAFERVPGATVEGSNAPPNSTVTASVEMGIPTTNETFTYTQRTQTDENGEFSMVLPYATTDYDEYGPENGYTNVSVRATGPYTFTTPPQFEGGNITQGTAQVDVSEGRVNGDVDEPKQVTLEEQSQSLLGDQNGNETQQNETQSGGSDTNGKVDTRSSGDDSDTSTDDTAESTTFHSESVTARAADA
jgi:dolichyl-diphosphooligosaccharide--protein glycosyltransferase